MTEDTNPIAASSVETDDAAAALHSRVQAVIDEVRPFIQMDGGEIELLKVEDNVVYVRLSGSCIGCPSSQVTLKNGVEVRMKEEVPEIESVEMV